MSARRCLHACAAACLPLIFAGHANAEEDDATRVAVELAQAPLFTQPTVPSNLMFIIDDSLSMNGTVVYRDGGTTAPFLPSNARTNTAWARPAAELSNGLNALAYDQARTYLPWRRADGSRWPNGTYTPNVLPEYWRYTSDSVPLVRVVIAPATPVYTGEGRQARTDCANAGATPPSCTYAEEYQNWRNWYTFHRTRMNAAKHGISEAFADVRAPLRVGWGRIELKMPSSSVDGVDTRYVVQGVRSFDDAHRGAFYSWLHAVPPVDPSNTALLSALRAAGDYFSRADARGPYGTTPGTAGGEVLECRRNYTVLMTDGDWDDYPNTTLNIRNEDGTGPTRHTGPGGSSGGYSPAWPYADPWDYTLADVAMQYWKNDLLPDAPNTVPTAPGDPAFWQHMNTFTVAFGIAGSMTWTDVQDRIARGEIFEWRNPSGVTNSRHPQRKRDRLDDTLHAALNGRGGHFSAMAPEVFASELERMLRDIVREVETSASSAAVSSATLADDSLLFRVGFRSGEWSGFLSAWTLGSDGSPGSMAWDAEALIARTLPAERYLFTVNDATGRAVGLDFGSLSDTQRAALDRAPDGSADSLGAARIAWLRGAQGAPGLRARGTADAPSPLGDIVNSNPQYVGHTDFGYRLLPGPEGESYEAFRASTDYLERPSVIYVGANDGLLHAFATATGEELFAFMPSELLRPRPGQAHAPISALMAPGYVHRYFLDGTPTIRDAVIDGAWRTVLVGSMGAGGRTVFALDVTDPTRPVFLWEFTHPDLGYRVGQPAIVRLRNGQWATIFGNGVNGESGTASLFVVALDDGALIRQLDTESGSPAAPNGVLAAAVTDFPDSDLQASRVYAGDLHGTLWRFDIGDADPAAWGEDDTRIALFAATDPDGDPQPITARPALARLPGRPDTLIASVGTGSYFRAADATSTQTQSIYAIFDRGAPVPGRAALLKQEIEAQSVQTLGGDDASFTYSLRQVSDRTLDPAEHRGWYLDLEIDGDSAGERVVTHGFFPTGGGADRIRYATMMPSADPCSGGRGGYLMDLDLYAGSRVAAPVFDLTRDGLFDLSDIAGGIAPSGVAFAAGETPATVRVGEGRREVLYDGRGRRLVGLGGAALDGRQSWKQLR